MKANTKTFVYIFAVVLMLTFLIGYNSQPCNYYEYDANYITQDYFSTLYIPVAILCILAYVLPVKWFSFFKKRINLDCAYSLPISRKAMGAVHYLTGLGTLWGAFTLSYLVNFLLLLSRGTNWFHFGPMLPHYFLCLILGFAMYSVMVFVFNEANTRDDGILFMVLYTFVFAFILIAIAELTEWQALDEGYGSLPWGVIDTLTVYYQALVEIDTEGLQPFWSNPMLIFWFMFWVVLGIGAAVGFFCSFGKRRMEKTEDISDSFFGFRTLIPIFAITGMFLARSLNSIIFVVLIEFFAIIGYTIYRRGFHYKKSDIIWLVLFCIFAFL